MAFKMKGFSGFKQIEKETPPKKQYNPRTYGVDSKRVEKIDTKRDIKLIDRQYASDILSEHSEKLG